MADSTRPEAKENQRKLGTANWISDKNTISTSYIPNHHLYGFITCRESLNIAQHYKMHLHASLHSLGWSLCEYSWPHHNHNFQILHGGYVVFKKLISAWCVYTWKFLKEYSEILWSEVRFSPHILIFLFRNNLTIPALLQQGYRNSPVWQVGRSLHFWISDAQGSEIIMEDYEFILSHTISPT